jgi:hypothetical protein
MTFSDTSKRIYVAGASAQIELIECFLAKLIEAGWTITVDWCAEVRAAGNVASPDDPAVRRAAALLDLEGVAASDVTWLVQPSETSTSTGAWVELGSAITRRNLLRELSRKGIAVPSTGPEVVVSGTSRKCIFSDLADYRFQSHEDAFDFIKRDLVIA